MGTGAVSVTSGATLSIVNSIGAAITNNLTLNGAGVSSNGALVNTGTNTLSGTVTLGSATTIGVTGGSDALTLNGIISGANSLTKAGSGSLVLSGSNTYSGATTVNTGTLSIFNSGSLGNTSSTSITSGATLNIDFSNGTLGNTNTITINGTGVSNNGSLKITGSGNILSNPITLNSNSSITSQEIVTLNGTITGAHNLEIDFYNSSIVLPSISLTNNGNLTVATNGNITQNNALSVQGASRFNAGAGSVTLTNPSNNFIGGLTLTNSGNNDISVANNNLIQFDTVNIGKDLFVTTSGSVTQVNALTVPGISSFTTNAANSDIFLASAANSFGSEFNITDNGNVRDVELRNISSSNFTFSVPGNLRNAKFNFDNNTIMIPAMTLANNLEAFAGGPINQSGAVVVNGNAILSAGAVNNIMLDNVNNNFKTIIVDSANNVSIANSTPLILGASTVSGNLTVNTNGDITQSGSLSINNMAILSSGSSNNITLTNTSNNIHNLTVPSGYNVSIYSNANLEIALATVLNNFNIVAQGVITQAGKISSELLTVSAINGITLNQENAIHAFNATNSNGNILLNNNIDPPVISGITQNSSGNISITNVGELNITGPISTRGGNVSLITTSENNLASMLTINANITTQGGSIYVNAANPNNVTPVLIVNGLLDTTGGIGQGVLTVGSGVELNVQPRLGSGNITLQSKSPESKQLVMNVQPINLRNVINVTSQTAYDYLTNQVNSPEPILSVIVKNDENYCSSAPVGSKENNGVIYTCSSH